ncbi:MAG TPA: hypothetical protein VG963_13360 [Polyangiaceae bacterium]|nr:hypothetical protein [Polyangiaceae bacterium]
MSQAQPHHGDEAYRLDPKSSWANAWKLSAAVAVVGIAGTIFIAATDHERFAFSYLFAYMAFLIIALGGVFFGLLQYLTSSGWSVTIRRTTEFLHWPLWLFVILFVPIALNLDQLYPWTQDAHAAHAAHGEHGEVQGGEQSGGRPLDPELIPMEGVNEDAEHQAHAKVLAAKEPYLNKTFFFIRAAIYFVSWVVISRKLFKNSTEQDQSGDPKLTVSSQRVAPAAIAVFALTTTFAAFDWLMSLEPSWISTIFGVNFFAQCIVALFAVTILIALSLRAQGHLKDAVNVEHFHDLGKLQFGFLVFWAYVNFSQYMLIWYASIPEETTYYHKRWSEGGDGWKAWSLAIVFGHFIIPFFVILSRNAKRALTPLGIGAAIILLFHFVMVYWLVMPYYGARLTEGPRLNPSIADLACLMAVGGLYFTLVFYRMTKHPLIPVKDPRLGRSLHFVNA